MTPSTVPLPSVKTKTDVVSEKFFGGNNGLAAGAGYGEGGEGGLGVRGVEREVVIFLLQGLFDFFLDHD